MKKQIILLNGPSSAGKSTLAKTLKSLIKEKRNETYAIVSIDDFLLKTDETIYEEDVFEISTILCEKVLSELETAPGVIIDHVITSERIFRQLNDLPGQHHIHFVHVMCPLEVLLQREQKRGDRYTGTAESSYTCLFPKDGYDLTVDTHIMTSAECSHRILQTLP